MTQAIVFAAGIGSRISDHIGAVPKSTLPLAGKPIIRRTVEALKSCGVEVTVCTGYRPEMIQRALEGIDVEYRFNPFFSVANNIVSFWMAQESISAEDDVLLVSADVVFEKGLVSRLMQDRDLICMATDAARVAEGDYFFKLDENRRILWYGADIDDSARDTSYIGLAKIGKAAVPSVIERLNEIVMGGGIQRYFEEACLSFIGEAGCWPSAVDMSDFRWVEIDRIEDYSKAVSVWEEPK